MWYPQIMTAIRYKWRIADNRIMIFMTHREFIDLISSVRAVLTRESHRTSMWKVRYDWVEGFGRATTWFQVEVDQRFSL